MRNNLLALFSQKYILQEQRLPDQADERLLLEVNRNINWHWDTSLNGLLARIIRDFEELTEGEFELYSSQEDCVVRNQPLWDMSEVMGEESARRPETDPSPERHEQSGCKNWRMERLAYYIPAHSGDASRYGIHLTMRGIARVAKKVHALCPEQPLEIIVLAAMFKLYAHELCHTWIEDVISLLDFSRGVKRPLPERRYQQTNDLYNHYILMEEAICNTAAYGWLHHFLFENAGKRESGMPRFDEQIILDAFAQWMRQQPSGYRDFLAIEQPPIESELFMQNFARLLIEIYQMSEYGSDPKMEWHRRFSPGVSAAIGTYFGRRMLPSFKHYRSRRMGGWDSLWSGEPPIHVELGTSVNLLP